MSDEEKRKLAEAIHSAWTKYTGFFLEHPHGTLLQIRALVELMKLDELEDLIVKRRTTALFDLDVKSGIVTKKSVEDFLALYERNTSVRNQAKAVLLNIADLIPRHRIFIRNSLKRIEERSI